MRRLYLLTIAVLTACAPATPLSPTVAGDAAPTAPDSTTAAPVPTTTLTATPVPTPVIEAGPVLPIGAIADWTASPDPVDIEGIVEVVSERELAIRDFVSLVAEAPGVDIRLGVGDDFSDAVAIPLRDITGKVYEGRVLRLTIPPAALGRTVDSIAVYCYATGDVFDFAVFETP